MALATIHARAFASGPRPWTAAEIEALADAPTCVLVVDDSRNPTGFAVFRVAADEAELLTIAVDPDRRRMGVGRCLLAEGLAQVAERGACRVFLEVGERNLAARRLYEGHGFAVVSERRGYYDGPDPQTALICLRSL